MRKLKPWTIARFNFRGICTLFWQLFQKAKPFCQFFLFIQALKDIWKGHDNLICALHVCWNSVLVATARIPIKCEDLVEWFVHNVSICCSFSLDDKEKNLVWKKGGAKVKIRLGSIPVSKIEASVAHDRIFSQVQKNWNISSKYSQTWANDHL